MWVGRGALGGWRVTSLVQGAGCAARSSLPVLCPATAHLPPTRTAPYTSPTHPAPCTVHPPPVQADDGPSKARDKFVLSVAYSPDGRLLAAGTTDGGVAVFDVAAGKLLRTLEGHLKPVRSLAFTPGTCACVLCACLWYIDCVCVCCVCGWQMQPRSRLPFSLTSQTL